MATIVITLEIEAENIREAWKTAYSAGIPENFAPEDLSAMGVYTSFTVYDPETGKEFSVQTTK